MSDIRGNTREASDTPPVPLPRALRKAARAPGLGPFDKAFAVIVSGPQGVTNGVGRNISEGGMFVETREPYAIGTEVRITFSAPELQTELTAVADVRFQCYLNFAGTGGDREGLRGMGVRFRAFEGDDTMPSLRPVTQ